MQLPLFWAKGVVSALGVAFLLFPSQFVSAAVSPMTTNDTFLRRQWYLDTIHAREGWNVNTGSRDVIIAVIDGGIDIDHPDLTKNIWTNSKEIPGNIKDDDGNGYIDDVHGWNFVFGIPDVRPARNAQTTTEAWVHGTVVSSLIAASGNDDIGISGVSWRARIMPLVVLGGDGFGQDNGIIRAIEYAIAQNVDIINLSLVGYEFDQDLRDVINRATAKGILVVSAAGNSENSYRGEDLDVTPGYPACDKGADGRGAITVTALTYQNIKVPYANYGKCVDVSAPGADMYVARPTTDPADPNTIVSGYTGGLSGTSLAAPLVSGLAALLKTIHPTWKGPEIADKILATVDSVDVFNPAFQGKLGKGRINVARALDLGATSGGEVASPMQPTLTVDSVTPGKAPEVRVHTADGAVVGRFFVGSPNDLRGFQAKLVQLPGESQQSVAILMNGDTSGVWLVYRFDGVLLAVQ